MLIDASWRQREIDREVREYVARISLLTGQPVDFTSLYRAAAEESRLWRHGLEPLPFDQFCMEATGFKLTDRQRKVFEDTGLIYASELINPNRRINELVIIWGKGAGKDITVAHLAAWYGYVVLHLNINIAQYYGLHPGSHVEIVNFAPTQRQAKEVFFDYIKPVVSSPLFAPFLTDPKRQILSDVVRFPQQNLRLFSMCGSASGAEGFNPLLAVLDECDDFPAGEGGNVAYKIRRIMRSSAATRMGNRSLTVNITYPRTAEGYIMSLKKEAEEDIEKNGPRSGFYVDLATTTEVRPEVNIATNNVMRTDYETDPELAAAMYECRPFMVDDAFFSMPEFIAHSVRPERSAIAEFHVKIGTLERDNGIITEQMELMIDHIRPKQPGKRYFLGCDGGRDGDSFGISMFSTDHTGQAPMWLCRNCVSPPLLAAGHYEAITGDNVDELERNPLLSRTIACNICGYTPAQMSLNRSFLGWHRRVAVTTHSISLLDEKTGVEHTFPLPTVTEELLIAVTPERRTTEHGNRPVWFPAVQEGCRQLIENLGLTRGGFDEWQTSQMVQTLIQQTGADIVVAKMSNPEQMRRAKMVKHLLYAGMITLLPDEARDREWGRLIRKGDSIDHPENRGRRIVEGKDRYDAESIAIWYAVTFGNEKLEAMWI